MQADLNARKTRNNLEIDLALFIDSYENEQHNAIKLFGKNQADSGNFSIYSTVNIIFPTNSEVLNVFNLGDSLWFKYFVYSRLFSRS